MGPSVQIREKYKFSSIIRRQREWFAPKMFDESNWGKLRPINRLIANRTERA